MCLSVRRKGTAIKMTLFNKIESKKVLVVGDIMLDTYYTGEVSRISPEAPVPVFCKKAERSVLGGAANVAANLIAAGQNVSIMSIVGSDETGKKMKGLFESQSIDTSFIFTSDRKTTEKTRLLASNNQQVLRWDVEDTTPLSHDDCAQMLTFLEAQIHQFNLILFSDYLKGLLTYEFTQGILRLAHANHIPVIVDVKDKQSKKYKGADLIKPNLKELNELTSMPVSTDEEIIEASEYLKDLCECKYVLTTCGAKGMVLVGEDNPYFIASVGQEVFDVTGAGDTAIAYLAACMVNGFSMKEAVKIANYAAGVQVSKVGTSMVYWNEVRERLSAREHGSVYKLMSGTTVENFRKNNINKKIVFTNGCFDIVHVGHLRYLQEAANLGDILVVGLNSDASVKRLKGAQRPINSERDRAEMLCALSFIDYVVIFEEDTPLSLIQTIQPDVLVKGGDYANEYVVGTKEVEARGGKLVLLPLIADKSTTNIINKIRK